MITLEGKDWVSERVSPKKGAGEVNESLVMG